ncbi:hypothetical protein ATCC90586_006402 [Pythium insidiosum]|nr:hypothetical protein ATCC90586_006402 [Pythium insidiosum]
MSGDGDDDAIYVLAARESDYDSDDDEEEEEDRDGNEHDGGIEHDDSECEVRSLPSKVQGTDWKVISDLL